jgi:hypothetical protein
VGRSLPCVRVLFSSCLPSVVPFCLSLLVSSPVPPCVPHMSQNPAFLLGSSPFAFLLLHLGFEGPILTTPLLGSAARSISFLLPSPGSDIKLDVLALAFCHLQLAHCSGVHRSLARLVVFSIHWNRSTSRTCHVSVPFVLHSIFRTSISPESPLGCSRAPTFQLTPCVLSSSLVVRLCFLCFLRRTWASSFWHS